jgi:nitroreductase
MTTTLARDEQSAIVLEAARAPSVHNIQPARWRFAEDGSVILFRAVNRTIPVADPTGHDLQASLGAAFEGMAIALSTRGLSLGAPIAEHDAEAPTCEPVVRASVERLAEPDPDPLAAWVMTRRSYRGRFLKADPADVRRFVALERSDARLLIGNEPLSNLATLHDNATWTFESRPEYHAELWSWLRLSPRDPRYRRDGLTADCLALSKTERWIAAQLLPPDRFALLAKMGVARWLVSEAAQVRSAGAALVFCPHRDDSPFDVGRRMYRLWLEVTAVGFHLAPMSASADDPTSRAVLEEQCQVPSERRVANVFRVGRIEESKVAKSPRLPLGEYLV